jgi:hypothetical protein
MMPPIQREALAVLSEVCDLSPEVRLGQLMAMLGELGDDHTGHGLWDIEDDELLAVLKHHREELRARLPSPPASVPAAQKPRST